MEVNLSSKLYDKILLNDKYGLAEFKTLNNSSIYIIFNRQKTSLEELKQKFFDNYSCKGINNQEFELYNKNLNMIFDDNLWKLASSLCVLLVFHLVMKNNIPERTTVNHYYELKNKIEKSKSKINIFLKTLTGKSIEMIVASEITVYELKSILNHLESIPEDQCRLIFGGKQLEDDCTLGDYNIGENSSIHIVLRLRGGMYHETSGKDGSYAPLNNSILFIDIDEEDKANFDIKI